MNHSLHRILSLAAAALSVAAIFAPAAASAFQIIAKLERDGNGIGGPGESACTSCANKSTHVSTSFTGSFPPPANPVALPANSHISGTASVDLATGVMRGSSHAASYGHNEQHQIRFVSRLEESITLSLPANLPADQRFITFIGEVHGTGAATNRAFGQGLYSLQVHNVSASASLDHINGWDVINGENNPAIVITTLTNGLRFRMTSAIPGSGVVLITSQIEGTAWAEARFTTGVGIGDVNATDTATLSMILPQGATYTSTSGVFLKPSAIQAWRQQYFGSPDNSGPGADTADPDNDGTVNLLEFATFTNPLIPTTLPIVQVLAGGNLEFTYTRNKAALGELTYAVEWNDTLTGGSWSTAGGTEIILSDDPTVQQIKATLPAGAGRRFVRLSVTRAGP